MPKPDPAHKETDKILRDMEKRLDEVYKQAYKEARQTADDFMKQFREMDKKKRQQVKDGELDKAEYDRWRRTQVFQGNRYHQMADTLAADMTHTNQIAASVINGYLPEVYAVNHNYGTYEIEKGSRINTQYTMYDRQTVERLMRDNPDLLPRKAAVNVPKDELWNKNHINSAVMQGIIQGDPIDKISQRLAATVTDMSHTSAIRNARTMTTSAQNGGRIDSYKRAESMGIKMLQVWMATLDGRTRHEHRQLDGQKRKVGEAFEVEGEKIFFPGDPAAEPSLVWNCRCTLIGEVEGVDYNLSDVSQRDNKLGDMTYEEWKEEKRKQDNAEPPAPKPESKPEPKAEDKPVEVEVPAPTVEKPDAVDEAIPQREAEIGTIFEYTSNSGNKKIVQMQYVPTQDTIDKYETIGIRAVPTEQEGKYGIGDILPESYDWDFENDTSTYNTTGETLGGSSALWVRIEDGETLEEAIQRALEGTYEYEGKDIFIVGGKYVEEGNDTNEVVIEDATAIGKIGIYGENEKIKDLSEIDVKIAEPKKATLKEIKENIESVKTEDVKKKAESVSEKSKSELFAEFKAEMEQKYSKVPKWAVFQELSAEEKKKWKSLQ
jgi:SPP1 gp7 family putative phage head morphogenesis protein